MSTSVRHSEPLRVTRRPLDYAIADTPTTEGNLACLLVGGEQAFPDMLVAIGMATRDVMLESYIISGDDTGFAFRDALVAAARRGCAVRVLYDAIGSWSLPTRFTAALREAGAEVIEYRPVAPWRRRWGLWRRDHRKILVVDDAVGFVGGLNIADEYDARTPAGRSWRDLQLRLEGPAVVQLGQLFIRNWNRVVPSASRVRWRRPTVDRRVGGVPVAILANRETRLRPLIRRAFLYAVRLAQHRITIVNPYFIPDAALARALGRAARRGVDVRIIVPSRSDVLLIDLASRHAFPSLMRAGVRIAEWPGMMHAKAAAIDGAWATVGSYNFDRRSLRFNLEVTANIFDFGVAAIIEQRLREDFEGARELERAALLRRSFWQRFLGWFAYRLRALL